MPEHHATENKI